MAEGLPAMILCAGLGTRLRPLSDWLAKPMVPIGDAPAVDHIARRLRPVCSRLVVNVHHRPDDVRGWAEGEGIRVSHEPELLGTAGGIANASPLLGEGDVLVWNGDILADIDVPQLLHAHRDVEATLVVVRANGEGNVGVDDRGRVVRLRRERFARETRAFDFVGIQIVGAKIRALLPAKGCIVGDVYIPALARGALLVVHEIDVPFTDVGSIASYVAANRAWLGDRASWSAASATVRAPIDGSIIGAGARIESPAIRSIVWPKTDVTTPIANAIATPFGIVSAP
jgi:mannose-1-phosphate guanylyltransferase